MMVESLNEKVIEKWKNADAIYATPTGSNDNWFNASEAIHEGDGNSLGFGSQKHRIIIQLASISILLRELVVDIKRHRHLVSLSEILKISWPDFCIGIPFLLLLCKPPAVMAAIILNMARIYILLEAGKIKQRLQQHERV
ncbi:carotenoid 9,10(9',10')-cleavage dioxygenase 1 [Iris pallida]|uniref:Carotenoid 9,10(9',10')-cleavage dioxygenase 1 n=1 Tax=Iris pallida TaxID=29817 RepID=A0AAX6I095_IRIPA|nr:carotenoid 9,10(9',10')-cleavage dioxygenase 1 [Iris pallida]KAJ6836568.1 carotenoid 9,10(9',10')-cleavage dioxygenase 1 [Iris pallida]KAJ6846164.1 carotenoid 9,10(9',10')-cleavage dioxygenase 1 [Iris pallida]